MGGQFNLACPLALRFLDIEISNRATSRRVARFQNRIVRSDGGGIRNQSELHVIDPNPSLTFSLIGIASTTTK